MPLLLVALAPLDALDAPLAPLLAALLGALAPLDSLGCAVFSLLEPLVLVAVEPLVALVVPCV